MNNDTKILLQSLLKKRMEAYEARNDLLRLQIEIEENLNRLTKLLQEGDNLIKELDDENNNLR